MNYEQLAIEGLAENKKFSDKQNVREPARPKLAAFIFERCSRQGEFAKTLKVSDATVSKWLAGSAKPQYSAIFRFHNEYGLEIAEIADLFDMPTSELPSF